jgi:hypothetical protein
VCDLKISALRPPRPELVIVVNYVALFKEVVRFSVCVCGFYIWPLAQCQWRNKVLCVCVCVKGQ